MNKKTGLGKGLGALLAIYDEENDVKEAIEKPAKDSQPEQKQKTAAKPSNNGVMDIDINLIYANPNQPRKNFDETALNELANSIKIHGIIQPLVVNEDNGKYMIIAGERRFRAAKLINLEKVPCVVKKYTEKQVKEIAIIENLQREDLNPIEAARAIKQLMEEYGLTQETVAERIGISRPNIANTLRLLNLCPDVVNMVETNRLTAGHARCLVPITDYTTQVKLAKMACDNKMTVRALEKLVKNVLNPEKKVKIIQEQSIELKEMVNEMQRVFATKVSVIGNDNKGRIYIDYYSRDDLDRINELMELIKAKKLTLKELSEYNKHFKDK